MPGASPPPQKYSIFSALYRPSFVIVTRLRWRTRYDRVHQHASQAHVIVTVTQATVSDKGLTIHGILELLQYVLPARGHAHVTELGPCGRVIVWKHTHEAISCHYYPHPQEFPWTSSGSTAYGTYMTVTTIASNYGPTYLHPFVVVYQA